MTDDRKAKQALKKALLGLGLRYEVFAAPGMAMQYVLLDSSVSFELSRQIETAATDGHRVMINPDWFVTLTDDEREGVCAHENMHVGLGHPWRMGTRDPKAWNLATDIGMNEYLKAAGLKLPAGGIYADTVIPLLIQKGCPRKDAESIRTASSETVYDLLMKYLATPGGGTGKMPTGNTGDVVAPPPSDSPQEKVSENIERLAAAVDRAEKIERQRGKIPAGLKGLIEKSRKNLVDWKSATWKFVQGSLPTDYSYRRTNRRYADDNLFMPVVERLGVGPICVMIDTSGSVPDSHLKAFCGEIEAIIQAVRPESVIVIPCDAEVDEDAVTVLGPDEHFDVTKITGRGGTSFRPPFDYLSQHDIQVDKIIYLTDMCGDFPEDPGVPTLWVSTVRENDTAPFGDVVVVDIT